MFGKIIVSKMAGIESSYYEIRWIGGSIRRNKWMNRKFRKCAAKWSIGKIKADSEWDLDTKNTCLNMRQLKWPKRLTFFFETFLQKNLASDKHRNMWLFDQTGFWRHWLSRLSISPVVSTSISFSTLRSFFARAVRILAFATASVRLAVLKW